MAVALWEQVRHMNVFRHWIKLEHPTKGVYLAIDDLPATPNSNVVGDPVADPERLAGVLAVAGNPEVTISNAA